MVDNLGVEDSPERGGVVTGSGWVDKGREGPAIRHGQGHTKASLSFQPVKRKKEHAYLSLQTIREGKRHVLALTDAQAWVVSLEVPTYPPINE